MRASRQVSFALTQDVQHCDHTLASNCQCDVKSPLFCFSGVIKKNLGGCPARTWTESHGSSHTRINTHAWSLLESMYRFIFLIVGVTLKGRSVVVVWKVQFNLCLQWVFTPCGPTVYSEITPFALKGPSPPSGVVWYCGRLVQHPPPSFKIRIRLTGTVQAEGPVSLRL